MDIVNRIESFVADIYFKYSNELKSDFVEICNSIVAFFDENFSNNQQILEQKDELLMYLLNVMEQNDYIKMADVLYYNVKPIIEDAITVINKND